MDNIDEHGLINRVQGSMMYKTNGLYNMLHKLNSKIYNLSLNNSKDFDVWDQ